MFDPLLATYQHLVGRRGVPPDAAARRLLRRPTVAAAMLLQAGQVDAAICGGTGDWWRHMTYLMPIIPKRPDVSRIYALSALILQAGALFVCDTHVNVDPTAEQIAEMTVLAADAVRAFGVVPKAALLSHSTFGSQQQPSARKMRQALALIRGGARSWRWMARCTPTPRWSEPARPAVPDSTLDGRGEPAGDADAGCGQHRFNLLKAGGGRAADRADPARHVASRSTCWCPA